MAMETSRLGMTGYEVGRLGIGLSEVGFNLELTDVEQVRSVINQALDNGVNFLDTAACYGISEELLGMVASERRGLDSGGQERSRERRQSPRPLQPAGGR